MASYFPARGDSPDETAEVDLSRWIAGGKRKCSPPPRPMSGFRAVNQPMETLAMVFNSEPEMTQPAVSTARMVRPVVEAREISSAEGSSSDDDEEAEAGPSLKATPRAAGKATKIVDDDENDDEVSVGGFVVYVSASELAKVDLDEVVDATIGHDVVSRIMDKLQDVDGVMTYCVIFEDGSEEEVPFERLLYLTNGQTALDEFVSEPTADPAQKPKPTSVSRTATKRGQRKVTSSPPKMTSFRPRAVRMQQGLVSTVDVISDDDHDNYASEGKRMRTRKHQAGQSQYNAMSEDEIENDQDKQFDDGIAYRTTQRTREAASGPARRSDRNARQMTLDDSNRDVIDGEVESLEDDFVLQSDLPGQRKRTRTSRNTGNDDDDSKRQRQGERQSRSTRHAGNMAEPGIDDIYRSKSETQPKQAPKPKLVSAKEIFKPLPRNDEFRMRHSQQCEVCKDDINFGPLIYCQGCSLAYHKACLGHRTNREHLVTKIGEVDFVLQCRRCVRFPQKKDATAPDQSICQDCSVSGLSCQPFRPRKTPGQEQKEREDNDGVDPSYDVDPNLVNNADNVLFRCVNCWRAYHFEHLPSRSNMAMMDLDSSADAEQRFREYSRSWKCKDCVYMPAKVSGLIAWKPTDEETYEETLGLGDINEDHKTYLIRWDGHSYFRAPWMPGAWVWGVTSGAMRKAFAKREDAQRPKMRTEQAIPEDYLRADIVLNIKFTSIVDIQTEEIDKARIREVEKALIKYKGLGYEDAVWEAPPTPHDGERWTDFVAAYHDWVRGRYVIAPKTKAMNNRLEKAHKTNFSSLEKRAQPDSLQGGKLMIYQLEGLNWLYYKWFTQKNAVLADEMGLGKTIQIIGFLATLVHDWGCWPFLIVVPNSTCPNWRREIKRWAPSLRVVAYYGSRESRNLAYRYEMYPDDAKELRCHIVVTSYDAAADDNCRKFFRGVQWQGLIVDEGQRLKSEKTLLFAALSALKAPFKILMTGTPLQNNQRELFNLLQFLDDSYKAAELEEQFKDLDQNKILKLHDMIRPFFLRRTKAQVLTFLPTMAQIIVPVSMSVLQKKVYRTILAKNPDLLRAIFSIDNKGGNGNGNGRIEKGSLNNILMQLRKCLCHPFVYSRGIEEISEDRVVSHRNLVDASSKLKLLELLLPKLQERGHRVLIFSQFLDMLDMVEDFLDGMQMAHQRLDGSIGTLEKQKRIDEYNAPDSPLFAFLLSTRAGGVGINLASADTVIILDPDFNPHQDIQALSRAHRIGQTKKVLCYQLVTRASAEEKIMQIGRKKLALDHVLIHEMDTDEATDSDLATILRFGANELFNDDGDKDIVYDPAGIERLLDRSRIEDTAAGEKSAEASFSHARVWANDSGSLQNDVIEIEEGAPDPGVWANILKERERLAAEESAAKAEAFGRGRRARGTVDYLGDRIQGVEDLEITPDMRKQGRRADKPGDESDTDFQADSACEDDEGMVPMMEDELEHDPDMLEIEDGAKVKTGPEQAAPTGFRRAVVAEASGGSGESDLDETIICAACHNKHRVGYCPLKLAGVEYCNLCGIAHFGQGRICPHIGSETQVRAMLAALKASNEPEHLVREATKYLKSLNGNLVQLKKQKATKEEAATAVAAASERGGQDRAMMNWQETGYPVMEPSPNFKHSAIAWNRQW